MSEPQNTILIVDPDDRARTFLARQVEPFGCRVLEAANGVEALATLTREPSVKVVMTELFLETGEDKCVTIAVRRVHPGDDVKVIAHTHRVLLEDRDWAAAAGVDAYLIKPTRASRVRYVVGRLLAMPAVGAPSRGPLLRRDSLDGALSEIEHGALLDTACIVFDRAWWQSLTSAERLEFRTRAKAVRVSLRSDSAIGGHYVEVRGRFEPSVGVSTERPESPYRR